MGLDTKNNHAGECQQQATACLLNWPANRVPAATAP
jgi:hypothetical protein